MNPALFSAWRRQLAITLLGFASGLPLSLTAQAMQAWLTIDGVDLATIGFMGLVGIPYTFKFLWAPLMDRFEPPWGGRRRGWLSLTQLLLAGLLLLISSLSPVSHAGLFAVCAVAIAFTSASQDIVFDAYRTDLLPQNERGLGASLSVFGYRIAMIVSGGLALIWADQWQSWPSVYRVMALLMALSAVVSLLLAPNVQAPKPIQQNSPLRELGAFVATLTAVIVTVLAVSGLFQLAGIQPDAKASGLRLLIVMTQIVAALGAGFWVARRAGFSTLTVSLHSFFTREGAIAFLVLIVLYKLGDAFAGILTTPFLLKAMAFSQTEVGVVNKVIGIWVTIIGVMAGGALMLRIGLYRALMLFGVMQLLSNAGFWALAVWGRNAIGSLMLPAFDWGFISIHQATPVDHMLLLVICLENLAGGMGTAAFVSLLMALCNQRFSATHFALLSALASVGRIYVSPVSGVLAPAVGWPGFFVFSMLAAVPGIVMVFVMRQAISALEQQKNPETSE